MKTGAIIRIVVGSLVAVVLTIALTLALTGGKTFSSILSGWDHNKYISIKDHASDDAKEGAGQGVTDGETASISASDVQKLEINWVAGSVSLTVGDQETLTFQESAGQALNEKQTLRYWLRDGKLTITYCEATYDTWRWLDTDKLNMPAKALTVVVPRSMASSLRDLEVNGVSATLNVDGVGGDEVTLETVSGEVIYTNATCNELDLVTVSGKLASETVAARELDCEAVSGRIDVSGAFDKLAYNTVSGNVKIRTTVTPREADGNSVSGEAALWLPKDSGFTANIDTVSGELTCNLPATVGKDRVSCGDGSAEFDFESVSGDVTISPID